MSRPRLLALLLALTTLVIFLPAMRCSFLVYDDDDYVTGNRMVRDGFSFGSITWAFTSFHAANWHPVTWLSHMADSQFFGINAGAHHLVNVMIHSVNAALLFVLLWRLTKKLWPAALVSALFAWHPLHVESVAWVAERKDVLSTCLALLTLLCYSRYVQENRPRHYWAAVVLFALGLMAKPMLVTLPFVLLLLDFWPLQRFTKNSFRWQLVLEKTPFFLLTTASCIVTCFAQRAAMSNLQTVPLSFRLANATVTVWHYLSSLFWPANLSVIYPFAPISIPVVSLTAVLLTGISLVVWTLRQRNPCWLIGWLWFLGTLVPVIGLVQVGSAARADRYTYMPAIGIFIALVYGLQTLAARKSWLMKPLSIAALLLLVCSALLTERQLGYWRDGETLFRHAIAVTQNNDSAHDNLGITLEKQGRSAEALAEYAEAVRLNPFHHQLRLAMGDLLLKMNQPAKALAEYQKCLELNPEVPALHGAAAAAWAAQGKYTEAMAEISKAEELDNHYALPHIVAAKIFRAQNQTSNAVTELWAAVRAEPYNADILTRVARQLATDTDAAFRDGRNAVILAIKANEIASEHSFEVFDVLGMALAETGDFTNAIICAQNAINLGTEAKLANLTPFQTRLESYQKQKPWREGLEQAVTPVQN